MSLTAFNRLRRAAAMKEQETADAAYHQPDANTKEAVKPGRKKKKQGDNRDGDS